MQCFGQIAAILNGNVFSADRWRSLHSYVLLATSTILCLIPFSGRAFHVDDTLFIVAAKNIAKHPFNPYGFRLIWEATSAQMSDVTQNPPLASYYASLLGSVFGWSERVLHLGFLVPAVGLVLGTYRLSQRFTNSPLLAGFATLLTPDLLISASSVMCDTMMLALWVWAAVFWVEGLDSSEPYSLTVSSILITLSAFAKYFGTSLLLLVFAYSVVRKRQLGRWALYLLIPVAALSAYQLWTAKLYGHGLLLGAAHYALHKRDFNQEFWAVKLLLGMGFTGACALSSLIAGLFLLPRKHVWGGLLLGGMASVSLMLGSIDLEGHPGETFVRAARGQHCFLITVQLMLCIAGGFIVLSLVGLDCWQERNADSLFLGLWVTGTLFFAAFLNWTLNARSILPLIPACSILVARRFDRVHKLLRRFLVAKIVLALLLGGAVSVWLAAADAELANSARTAAIVISERFRDRGGALWFGGHWGFQYYMESLSARPVDWDHPGLEPGDYVVIPHNNTWVRGINPRYVVSVDTVGVPIHSLASTISWELGAGFYDSFWGPLAYGIGPAPTEIYTIVQIAPTVIGAPLSDLRSSK